MPLPPEPFDASAILADARATDGYDEALERAAAFIEDGASADLALV